jgi:hypothetical protein
MKLRHAAALALVGWYLMVLPSDRHSIDRNAPLGGLRKAVRFGRYFRTKQQRPSRRRSPTMSTGSLKDQIGSSAC